MLPVDDCVFVGTYHLAVLNESCCFFGVYCPYDSEVVVAEFIDLIPYEFPVDREHLIVLNDNHS